jgi:glycosyltransferase involved in cell wall biosynthesis
MSDEKTIKISFCIIVKNEEEQLPRCLESVRSAVDEMIVVDTGSRDRTIDIAKTYGASVYSFEWCDDFSAARNEALRHAQGD